MGKWDVSRLERGKTQLKLDVAQRVAKALDVSIAEVLGVAEADAGPGATGFSDDMVAYDAGRGDPFAPLATDNRYLMQATSDCLDLAGIHMGDVLVADGSAEACERPPPLAAVRVQFHPDPVNQPGLAYTLLRQFLPPRLVVTNSSKLNAPTIDLEKDDAQILAVIVSVHRKLG